jgi:EAL domain-containing protein (putative c-di-GMP-specific phosphodiesterase class I)/ActR/RegA family two-component response regulator
MPSVAADARSGGRFGSLNVLIVDDNSYIVGLVQRYLERLQVASTRKAHDGAEALQVIDSSAVDIVLCDLSMPGMDGIEFLRHLAGRPNHPAVVLLSGHGNRILNTAIQLGRAHGLQILGALSKPFSLPSLKALLEQACIGASGQTRPSFEPLTPDAIRAGLQRGAVELAFQPKIDVRHRRMIGVESFLRWREPDGQLMSPAAVIPVAEAAGLISDLTRVIIRKAMAQRGLWQSEGHTFSVAINVSLQDIESYEFPDFVVATAASEGIDPSSILLEITESQIMADVVRPLEVLSRLRLKGIGLAIDDYGTGASTMQQLKRIPFTELKIDREFVAGAPEDGTARAMLSACINLGKDLGLKIVAEGVETEGEWHLVASRGVDAVQGYLIAQPMSAAALSGWLASSAAGHPPTPGAP